MLNVHQAILPERNWNYHINSASETTRLWEDHKHQLPYTDDCELGSQVYFRIPAEGFIFYNAHFKKHLEPRRGKWEAKHKPIFGVSIFTESDWDNYQEKIKLCLEEGTFTIDLGGKPSGKFQKLRPGHLVPAIEDVVIR